MDTMEKYKIRGSIKDVIGILDSAPIHADMVPETNLVQLTNRVPIAHLAIERGLKSLIAETGKPTENIHGLHKLYRDLEECAEESAKFLSEAFQDAVKFFGYNLNTKGYGHFVTLNDYLSKTGTEKAFEALRYWAIGETGKGESPIPYISPQIHRELLRALWCLFLPNRRETVSDRVEHEVGNAMFGRRSIYYNTEDISKKESVHWYINWLTVEHATRCSALREAVERNFTINDGDEFVSQTLRKAYSDLLQSKDPAVQYYVRTLTYLPKGSQPRNPDAVPDVDWLGENETVGMAVTPAGTCLGFIEKYPDGGWGIEPAEEGLVQITEIAKSVADAKHYLVNRLTNLVSVIINGESKELRIISDKDFFPPPTWYPDMENLTTVSSHTPTYELEFWDAEHGLHPGEEISVELQLEGAGGFISVIKGTVKTVAEQKVSIVGTETLGLRETGER